MRPRTVALLLLWFFLPFFLLTPVTQAGKPAELEEVAAKYVVAVSAKDALGHACPISATEALTVEHVSSRPLETGRMQIRPLVWSDGTGRSGSVVETMSDYRRDLSVVRIVGGGEFARIFPIAKAAPAEGDRVLIVGYDFRKGMKPLVVWAKVVNIFAGNLMYDRSGGPGSSGSCVLNEAGEVVAINEGAIPAGWQALNGIGVLVVGEGPVIPEMWQNRVPEE